MFLNPFVDVLRETQTKQVLEKDIRFPLSQRGIKGDLTGHQHFPKLQKYFANLLILTMLN